ncbi:MAG: hypothetical protein AAGA75_20675 [Cyanobacteria bacterium P01_E01_bin.6]
MTLSHVSQYSSKCSARFSVSVLRDTNVESADMQPIVSDSYVNRWLENSPVENSSALVPVRQTALSRSNSSRPVVPSGIAIGGKTISAIDVSRLQDSAGTAYDIESDEFDSMPHWENGDHYHSTPHPSSSTRQTSSNTSQEEAPIAFLPTQRAWRNPVPIVLMGGAIATSAGFAYLESSLPQFEGNIQVAPQIAEQEQSIELVANSHTSTAISAPESLPQPSFSISEHADFLESTIIPQALTQLQAKDIEIAPTDLVKEINLTQRSSGVVEIAYQANQPEQVNDVLKAIAQAYQSQSEECQSQSCLNATYIQAQIPFVENTLTQLMSELTIFREQHQFIDVEQKQRELEVKNRQFAHIQNQLNRELSSAHAQFEEQHVTLGITFEEGYKAQELLTKSSHHQHLIAEWEEIDRQLVGELMTALDETRRVELAQDYERLSAQLYREIHLMVQDINFYDVDSELWYAIVEKPQRANLVEAWLNQAQLMQLLAIRQSNLTEVAQELDAENQQWRSLVAQHKRIESDIRTTAQTLADYQERYSLLQHQSMSQEMAWQLVSPPEISQMESPLTSATQWLTKRFTRPAYAQEPSDLTEYAR